MRIGQYENTVTMFYGLTGCHQQRRIIIVLHSSDCIDKRLIGQGMELFSRSNLFQLATECGSL